MPSENPSDSPFAANLNPRQREAVLHRAGPLMIIAGAGTGKTRVITHRIAFLAREVGIPIQEIMAVTFTNKAAKEMRERVCRLLNEPDTPGLAIGTFHSRCAMILRRDAGAAGLDANFAILDDSDQKQAIKRALKELDISSKLVTPGQVQSFINGAKMKLLTPADTAAEFDEDQVPYPAIYKRYQELLEQAKSLDFEDLLMRTVLLFQDDDAVRRKWSSRYRYLLVDEYQDTNHAQFLLTKLLAGEHREVCVVGDEDQSIYSWRGAEISNLLDFEKAFPGTTIVKLEQNYRSTGNILKAASTVIARNTQRIGKELFTELEDGDTISFLRHYDQEQEARSIAEECLALIHRGTSPSELAIFYRSHWLSRAIEDAMRKLRVPYRIVGGIRFYDRQEIKDLLSFLRLAVNPHDDLAMERVINRPIRGVGDKTVSNIGMRAAAAGTSWFDAARAMLREGEIKGKARAGLDDFLGAVARWNAMARGSDADEILDRILADTEYRKQGVGDPDSIEGESRLENIDEFSGLVQSHVPEQEEFRLAEFLNRMSLDSSEEKDDGRPKVNLLTIHNAKGLEFEHVFIVGLEHRVFPTGRAEDNEDPTAIEEERRLFYVALTRARRKLHLNYATTRNRGDYFGGGEPSRFLSELPASAFDTESHKTLARLLPHAFGRGSELGGSRPGIGGGAGRRVVGDDEIFTPLGSAMPSPRTTGRDRRTSFQVGDRVVHRIMGQGEIVELGGRRGWERAVIQFDDGRVQDFVLKFAPIEPAAG